ncbi:MAG: aminopeptidase P N-terminal domain-containing protein [Erysipelotrichaceae bacterium]
MNYQLRRNKVLDLMSDNSLAIFFAGESLISNADQVYPFWVNSNFYYLTGLQQEKTILVLSKFNGSQEQYIYTIKPNPLKARWDGNWLSFDQVKEISGVNQIKDLTLFDNLLPTEMKMREHLNIYLDLEHSRSANYQNESFTNKVKEFANASIYNSFSIVAGMRSVKDADEIAAIRKSISYTATALDAVKEALKSAKSESDIEAAFNYSLRMNGMKSTAFSTIVAAGKNATTLHYGENNQEFVGDELLLIDCGARFNNYASDITRTYPINGKFSARQKEVYSWVLGGMKVVFKNIKPGISCNELNDILKEYYAEVLTKAGLIKDASEVGEYYMHGVSHSLGIDTHDVGLLRAAPLVAGNVITVEPGLYINQWDIGIRIEDDILVTDEGFDNLSSQIKKEISEIES